MASRDSSSRAARVPFSDATSRANTANPPQLPIDKQSARYPDNGGYREAVNMSASVTAVAPEQAPCPRSHHSHHRHQYHDHQEPQYQTDVHMADVAVVDASEVSKRNSAASRDSQHTADSKRTSQYSSCDGFPNKKSHIGPWQLGKTLGKGSSARVRAARHCVTHQPVAVKIIAKKTARMTQSGSIAHLDQVDSNRPENINGLRRMPLAIEREVAILKLIEHPNIVKLYDIWENRNEIYLILEYVENGDLFTYVSRNGALTEEASIFVFRQMMSAVQYCHAYNICHRDLKPENILLKSDGQIKIADFGMAALHQGPRSHLQTSCGSPHYAAPELLKARPYRGDKADIWSMGVILFVMLAGRLPFDEDDMGLMLAKAKKGIYTMPASFSPEAKDLVHRILQIEPEVRISMNQMWQHPLVWKYGYLDDLGSTGVDGHGQAGRGVQISPLDLAHIDMQIFRQLHSMWHTLRENDLAGKLVSNEPNDQKLFYWLLYNYRERQQENYNPALTHSMSDYHHVSQGLYSKKVSTRQFSQSTPNGHKRSVSRFTVISNATEADAGTENGTVKSYDPYKASVVMHPGDARASHAKIIVHRNNPNVDAEVRSIVQAESMKARTTSAAAKKRVHSQQRLGSAAYLRASRGSMSSIRSTRSMRSINGKHGVVRPSSRHKRGVDFSKARKPPTYEAGHSISNVNIARSRDDTLIWNEDLTDFSCKIAKDLDEAFMSSLLAVGTDEGEDGRGSPYSLQVTSPEPATSTPITASSRSTKSAGRHPWDSRPLPPSPPRSDSVEREIMQSKAERAQCKDGISGVAGLAAKDPARISVTSSSKSRHQVRIIDVQPPQQVTGERRVVSAPAYSQTGRGGAQPLPSICEVGSENWAAADRDKPRAVSAPSRHYVPPKPQENQGLEHLAQAEKTIRLVVSPTGARSKELTATPKPLNLPKKISRMANTAAAQPVPDARTHYHAQMQEKQLQQQPTDGKTQKQPSAAVIEDVIANESVSSSDRISVAHSKRSWFRRQSKLDTPTSTARIEKEHRPPSPLSRVTEAPAPVNSALPQALSRRKSFIFPFWKALKSDTKLASPREDDGKPFSTSGSLERPKQSRKDSTNSKKSTKSHRRSAHSSWYEDDEEPNTRKIEPQQNWLSRLFRVKPATRHLCLVMSQRRARQEVALLLREWRRYGIRDIEVDKERSIVFARVASTNYLGIREVSFACEIVTVIEHGKRNHLSIIRMTQEKGSANSFHKVADTIKSVMRERHFLVSDKRKAKMMVKTLNS